MFGSIITLKYSIQCSFTHFCTSYYTLDKQHKNPLKKINLFMITICITILSVYNCDYITMIFFWLELYFCYCLVLLVFTLVNRFYLWFGCV